MNRWLLIAALLSSCASSVDDETDIVDAVDDCVFCDDRADAHGVPRASYLAYGILAVANTATHTELDIDAGLDVRAANGIVAQRPFEFIEQLDTVPYVGRSVFAALSAYAEDNGYVPSCGDGALQPLVESCDDGNTVSGDGCSDVCEAETAQVPVLADVAELIRGSEISAPQVRAQSYYLREREVSADIGFTAEMLALLQRADGIKANATADGYVAFDELAILSTSPFYDSLHNAERALLDDIWEIYEVGNDPIVAVMQEVPARPFATPVVDIQAPGPMELWPQAISSFDPAVQDALRRLQRMPRVNLDGDDSTVELTDIQVALADYDQVFTDDEFNEFAAVEDELFDRSTGPSTPGRFDVEWPFVGDRVDQGPDVVFDGYEFPYRYTESIDYVVQNETGWVEHNHIVERYVTVNGRELGPIRGTRGLNFRTLGRTQDTGFNDELVLFEHWDQGQRVYRRLLYVEQSGLWLRKRYHSLFLGDVKDASGQRYRLDLQPDRSIVLSRSRVRTSNLENVFPSMYDRLTRAPAGRYTWDNMTLDVYPSGAVTGQKSGCDVSPFQVSGYLTGQMCRTETSTYFYETKLYLPSSGQPEWYWTGALELGTELKPDRGYFVERR